MLRAFQDNMASNYSSHLMWLNPFPKWPILDFSKQKQFADNNFKFEENGGKFTKRVENTVGKEEIAHYEQFLLFQRRFQKTCSVKT